MPKALPYVKFFNAATWPTAMQAALAQGQCHGRWPLYREEALGHAVGMPLARKGYVKRTTRLSSIPEPCKRLHFGVKIRRRSSIVHANVQSFQWVHETAPKMERSCVVSFLSIPSIFI